MGLSHHHWRPPLKFEDFQFEQGRLVYIRGIRPQYIDGYALINAMEQLAILAQGYKDRYERVPEELRLRIEHHLDLFPSRHHFPRAVDIGGDPPIHVDKFDPPKYRPFIDAPPEMVTHTSISRQPLSPDADPGGDSSGNE